MKQNRTAVFLMLICINFFSCIKPGQDSSSDEGTIYFRWIQDLTHPTCAGCNAWCDIRSGNFKDNNNAVPDFANEDTYYGPCEPGTYNAEYNFDRNNSNSNLLTFTYKLEKPAPGYIRYYTKNLREYRANVNRCLSVSLEPSSLTYEDVKQ